MGPIIAQYVQIEWTCGLLKNFELINLVRRAAKDPDFYGQIASKAADCSDAIKREAEGLVDPWKSYRESELYMDREDIDQFLTTCFKWYFLPISLKS
jgi:hypothetical protein